MQCPDAAHRLELGKAHNTIQGLRPGPRGGQASGHLLHYTAPTCCARILIRVVRFCCQPERMRIPSECGLATITIISVGLAWYSAGAGGATIVSGLPTHTSPCLGPGTAWREALSTLRRCHADWTHIPRFFLSLSIACASWITRKAELSPPRLSGWNLSAAFLVSLLDRLLVAVAVHTENAVVVVARDVKVKVCFVVAILIATRALLLLLLVLATTTTTALLVLAHGTPELPRLNPSPLHPQPATTASLTHTAARAASRPPRRSATFSSARPGTARHLNFAVSCFVRSASVTAGPHTHPPSLAEALSPSSRCCTVLCCRGGGGAVVGV